MSKIVRKNGVRSIEFVTSFKRVKRRGRPPSLPRKAVEPICYISVRLRCRIFERRVPAKSNHGRNDYDYNQQSLHVQDCQKQRGEINGNRYIAQARKAPWAPRAFTALNRLGEDFRRLC